MLLAQVDFITGAVDRKGNGLFRGRVVPVHIADQEHLHALRHYEITVPEF